MSKKEKKSLKKDRKRSSLLNIAPATRQKEKHRFSILHIYSWVQDCCIPLATGRCLSISAAPPPLPTPAAPPAGCSAHSPPPLVPGGQVLSRSPRPPCCRLLPPLRRPSRGAPTPIRAPSPRPWQSGAASGPCLRCAAKAEERPLRLLAQLLCAPLLLLASPTRNFLDCE